MLCKKKKDFCVTRYNLGPWPTHFIQGHCTSSFDRHPVREVTAQPFFKGTLLVKYEPVWAVGRGDMLHAISDGWKDEKTGAQQTYYHRISVERGPNENWEPVYIWNLLLKAFISSLTFTYLKHFEKSYKIVFFSYFCFHGNG